MSLPPSICTYINYVTVLHLLGRNVKDQLPQTFKCLICPHWMSVMNDVLGGAWFHCPHCGFAGDVFELYQHIRGIEKISTAIKVLQKELGISLPYTECAEYIDKVHPKRKACMDFWHNAQHKLVRLGGPAQQLLHTHGLYTGYPWRIHNPLGFATKYDTPKLPKGPKLQGSALVIPMQDMPGRYIGFHFMGNKFQKTYTIRDSKANADAYAGIVFLDNLSSVSNKNVYIVEDYMLAVRLGTLYQLATGEAKCPVISWIGSQPALWSAVNAQHVTFWGSDRKSLETQAAKCTARIVSVSTAVLPDSAQLADIDDYLKVLQAISETAEIIKDQTGDDVKGVLRDEVKYIEKPDGLYKYEHNKWRHIAKAKFTPERLLRLVDNGNEMRCQGTLRCQNATYPVDYTVNEFETRSGMWLDRTLLFHTGKRLETMKPWRSLIYPIGHILHPVKTYDLHSGIQWDAEKSAWNTPNFEVTSSSITQNSLPYGIPYVAGHSLHKVTDANRAVLTAQLADPSAAAAFTIVAHNVLARIKGWKPYCIAMEHNQPNALIEWISLGIGLVETPSYKCRDIERFLTEYSTEALPTSLTLDSVSPEEWRKQIRRQISANVSANIVLPCYSKLLAVPEYFPAWRFIPGTTAQLDSKVWWLLLEFFQYLSARDNAIPDGVTTLAQVAAAVADWSKIPETPAQHKILRTEDRVYTDAQCMVMTILRTISPYKHKQPVKALLNINKKGVMFRCGAWSMSIRLNEDTDYNEATLEAALRKDNALLAYTDNRMMIDYDWWLECCGKLVIRLQQASGPLSDLNQLLAQASS